MTTTKHLPPQNKHFRHSMDYQPTWFPSFLISVQWQPHCTIFLKTAAFSAGAQHISKHSTQSRMPSVQKLHRFNMIQLKKLFSKMIPQQLGATLLGHKKPIAFASKTLTGTNLRYASIERELLAIVYGCEQLHTYLYRQVSLQNWTTSQWKQFSWKK